MFSDRRSCYEGARRCESLTGGFEGDSSAHLLGKAASHPELLSLSRAKKKVWVSVLAQEIISSFNIWLPDVLSKKEMRKDKAGMSKQPGSLKWEVEDRLTLGRRMNV